MSEQAGTWQRVSTGGQDEASQLPDLQRWCDSHDYEVAARYVLHGMSASKGKQDAALDQVVRDMQDGKITVLVVWQSSRIERRGAYSVFDLARRVREAGGRIEYVKDAYLNDTNEMSDVLLALAATKDRQKSRDISVQVKAKQDALRSAGSVVGRAPWGYQIAKRDGVKILTPTADGSKYIPAIFRMIIDGSSLREVAAFLDSEGVKPMGGGAWHEGYIGNRLVKNGTYYGSRPNAGQLETEPLVSFSTWQEANAKLAARARGGRGPDKPNAKRESIPQAKALLSPRCGNPACNASGPHPSPMYRIMGGAQDKRMAYYRCTGSGPRRHGCGNMIPLAELDATVTDAVTNNHANLHYERTFVAGDDRSDEIGKLRESGADAMKRGDYVAATEAMRQASELESQPRQAPHWTEQVAGPCADVSAMPSELQDELRASHALCQHQSEGEYFASLNADGQRDYLAAHEITARKDSDGITMFRIDPKGYPA